MIELKKLIIGLAETFGITLTESRMQIYVGALSDLPLAELQRAVNEIVRDPEQKFFPLPAVIRDRVCGGVPLATAAQELLARAIYAAGAFGYYDADGARAYLGDVVWGAMPGAQGWRDWCAGVVDPGVARAQLRERILAGLRQTTTETRIAIPPPGNVAPRGFIPFEPEALPENQPTRLGAPVKLVVSGRDKAAGKDE